ncbi:Translocation and assembly module TamB [Vibrio aerogenes CECT 7868]|uniref:Translocation and assembly module TamB n=1 Tax=Vibrio aerogenes CECT 7868 TaxID=1216006 RepID=A0A1M5XKI1_9VIBR|nr:translocation/assembly module TamB domain-containing protein [Vibrio aerogenes]SHI00068.1 Translocation and assembly module TamB [Vibrio aerogenes CECT 7868]
MMRFMFRFGKYSFVIFCSLLLVSAALLAFILLSPAGLKLALWSTEKIIPSLEVGYAEGALGRSFVLTDVRYKDPDTSMDIRLSRVAVDFDSHCFLQPALCVNSLAVSGADIQLPDGQPDPETAESGTTEVRHTDLILPVPVRFSRIELNDVHLSTPQATVVWQAFSGGVHFYRNQLHITKVNWHQVDVTLTKSKAPPPVVKTPAVKAVQDIQLPEIWIPLRIDVPEFHLSGLTLHLPEKQSIDQFDLAVSAEHHRVHLQKAEIKNSQLNLSLAGEIELNRNFPLDLQLESQLKASPLAGQSVTLAATGSLQQLETRIALDGKINGKMKAKVAPLSASEHFPFQVEVSDLSGGWPLVDSPTYHFGVDRLMIEGNTENYQVHLNGQMSGLDIPETDVRLSGSGTKTQFDLAALELGLLNGSISGHSAIHWQDGLSIQSDIQLSHIEPQVQWPSYPGQLDGTLKFDASMLEPGWAVSVSQMNLTGKLRQYPLQVAGKFEASGNIKAKTVKLDVPGMNISHGPNYLSAKGSIDQKIRMDIGIHFPDLSKSVKSLAGQVQGKVNLAGLLASPDIRLNLSGRDIRWQSLFSAGDVSMKGHLQSAPEVRGEMDVQLKRGTYQNKRIESASLNIHGTQQDHQARMQLKTSLGEAALRLSGSAVDNWKQWRGELRRVDFQAKGQSVALEKPTGIFVDTQAEQVRIQAHCWMNKQARLCLDRDAELSAKSGQVQLSLNHLQLEQLASLFPEAITLSGDVRGEADVQWQPGTSPELTMQLEAKSGVLTNKAPGPVSLQWDILNLQGHIKNNQLSLHSLLDLSDNGQIKTNLEIPDITHAEDKIQGNIAIQQVSLDFLKGFLGEYSDFHTVVNSQIQLKGKMSRPQVYGDLRMDEMRVKGRMTPVDIREGTLRIGLHGSQADWLADVKTPDGALSLKGEGNWKSPDDWRVSSHLYSDGVEIKVLPMVRLKALPDIQLTMTPKIADVTGEISLPEGEIKIDQLPEGAIKVSDDQVILDTSGQPLQREKLPLRVNTHIRVKLGDNLSVAAFGLKGRLKGILDVTQRDQAPFIHGEVNILDGSYRSFGQDLLIQQGKILMNGPADQPYVSITAIRNPEQIEDDVTAGIQVTGPADNPSVTVFSDPSMPQANALSYLLRGKNLTSDSGGHTVTSSLIGLTLAQSGKLVGELGQAFGVQDLELDTNGAGDDTQVTVSGYILPGLQVKYGVGIFNSVGEFTVRYRLMKDLYLEAVSGLTNTVDLLYQFEFN